METPTPKKRRRLLPILLGAIVLCVVLAFIGALLSPSEEPAEPVADQPPASASTATVAVDPTATPQPLATATPVQPRQNRPRPRRRSLSPRSGIASKPAASRSPSTAPVL